MAMKATVFKVNLDVSDTDRHYYGNHVLTIACHPSETEQRMMVRLLVFALYAHEQLQFTRGISSEDEPDLWQKSLSGDIERWIELGQPDERRIRKACGRAQEVIVCCYGGRLAEHWRQEQLDTLGRHQNLTVINILPEESMALAAKVQRTMSAQCLISDGQIWFTLDGETLQIQPEIWKVAHSAGT